MSTTPAEAGHSPTQTLDSMERLTGVRFREAGKVYYFDAVDLEVEVGEYVIVETARGLDLGTVVVAPGQVIANESEEPLKPILRIATGEDVAQHEEWRRKERDTTQASREVAQERGFPGRIVSSNYNLDGAHLTVFYESEERSEFRDFARELGRRLSTKVEMKQVGPRDRAKLADGYDRCGERLCCSSWLTSFPTISIKMAKEQELPLNPAKISGVCGRLFCCLVYEYDMYKEIRGQMPRTGQRVTTPFGEARVLTVNAVRETVAFQLEDLSTVVMPFSEVHYGTVVRPVGVKPKLPHNVRYASETPAEEIISLTPSKALAPETEQPTAPVTRPAQVAPPGNGERQGEGGGPRRRHRGRRGGRRR